MRLKLNSNIQGRLNEMIKSFSVEPYIFGSNSLHLIMFKIVL